jgi:AI-2 transport protein TqsA
MPEPPDTARYPILPRWRDPDTLRTVVFVLVGAASGWYLMLQLASVLRPLLIAVLLAYVLMPYHSRLRKQVGTPAAIGIIATLTAGVLVGLAFIISASVLDLREELPQLQKRADELLIGLERTVAERAPWVSRGDTRPMREQVLEQFSVVARAVLGGAATAMLEACVVVLYLLFLLLEGSQFPTRVRRAYTHDKAEQILQVAGEVNAAVISYLKAKVKSSLVLAAPVGLILSATEVKFAVLWAVLTFLCNFIPYIGTVVAYALPVGFAFLLFEPTQWQPITAAALLLVWHGASSAVFEPMLLGNAVGLSPLVILGSLALWGLLWGVPGMFLAVPLTAVMILVMEHFDHTRAVARLLKGG